MAGTRDAAAVGEGAKPLLGMDPQLLLGGAVFFGSLIAMAWSGRARAEAESASRLPG
jgi:hypothetical protein